MKELHEKLSQGLLTPCISLCVIRKCPHISILRWFVKSILLTFSFGPLSWNRHDVSVNAWSRFDQQLSEKTDVSLTHSNKTSRFRFSTKYLKLKVVLQIVCLVPVLLVPKLIFFYQQMNFSLRILKTLHLVHVRRSSVALQCCDASRIKESSVRSRDRRQ